MGVGARVGAADLAEDLLLADDERVEPGCDGEEVFGCGLGVPHVGMRGHLIDGQPGMLAEDVAHRLQRRVEGVNDGVDLGCGCTETTIASEIADAASRRSTIFGRSCSATANRSSTPTGALRCDTPNNSTLTMGSPVPRRRE